MAPKSAATPGTRTTHSRARARWLLPAILALSLAVRLWGIQDRLPDASLGIPVVGDTAIEETDRTTFDRTWAMWRGGTRPLDLNPHTGGWPALSFYLTLGVQYLYKLYYTISTPGADAAEFERHILGPGATSLFLFARIVGALIGTLTVFLTYRIARPWGREIGLLAALFLATNPLQVLTSQHISDPNLLALLFVLLATPPILRVASGGSRRDSILAGAMIGLGGACKYVPLVLMIPLILAHLAHRDAGSGGSRSRSRPSLWAGLLAVPVALFVGSPFLFLDWNQTLRDVTNQRHALFSSWVGQTGFPISLPTYVTSTLPSTMGWPMFLLAIVGLVLLWRRGTTSRLLVSIPVFLVLAYGLLRVAQERYALPAIPFLHMAAALAVIALADWTRVRFPVASAARALAPAALALVLPAVLAAAWPLPRLVSTRQAMSFPDSRHLSRRWILGNVGPNEPIAVEQYGPVFEDNERAIVTWPFLAVQADYVRASYHPEWLDGVRYYVTSGEVVRRFDAAPSDYPEESSFHAWVRSHGARVWTNPPKDVAGPKVDVWVLPPRISTREDRDRLWQEARLRPMYYPRFARWCRALAMAFLRQGDYARAEEWAARGLTIPHPALRRELFETLSLAEVRQGKASEAALAAREGLKSFPDSPLLHLNSAAALETLGKREEAIAEYRAALQYSGNERAARLVRSQIARLEGKVP